MDKKKNGAAGTTEDNKPVPLAKARPAQSNTPIRPNNHGERSKASATPGSDKDSAGKTHAHTSDDAAKAGPQKKRRKVTHACVYCRRSHMTCDLERPCTRCIKRNIGHLCHDEPRDNDSKKAGGARGSTVAGSTLDESESQQSQADLARSTLAQASAAIVAAVSTMGSSSFDAAGRSAGTGANAGSGGGGITAGPTGSLDQTSTLQQLVRPAQLSQMQASGLRNSNMNQFAGFSDAWLTAQNHLQDMQNYQNNYLITPEVSNEFNLLNEFLNSSLLDDGGLLSSGDQNPILKNDEMLPAGFLGQAGNTLLPPSALSRTGADAAEIEQPAQQQLQSNPLNLLEGDSIARLGTINPDDKKRREVAEFYLQVADPSGNDTPEARMERVLRAKYEAGLLKPFNYIQGYKKLQDYLETHIQPSSKQKILAQINKFRPKFREKVQAMTDLQLVYVEMWFEKTLMEYDRVFASMAVPACCWRRTGEIFRGNKEMAELIGVEVENLRDGKIALHQILTETSMVRYWEEFGTIAFDSAHDTLLTACQLKCPSEKGNSKEIKCCFSLKIRRDEARIPSLIVGNFLPHDPSH